MAPPTPFFLPCLFPCLVKFCCQKGCSSLLCGPVGLALPPSNKTIMPHFTKIVNTFCNPQTLPQNVPLKFPVRILKKFSALEELPRIKSFAKLIFQVIMPDMNKPRILVTPEMLEAFVSLKACGWSYKRIAPQFKVSWEFVRDICVNVLEFPKRKPKGINPRRFREDHCQFCSSSENLHIHHLNHNHKDNRPSNLATLCANCHYFWHTFISRTCGKVVKDH